MPTPGEFQPGELHLRVKRLDVHLAVAHLDDQSTGLGEMVRRLRQNAAHQVQPVLAAGERQGRFMVELVRHVGDVFGIDVGRIGQDQVETLLRQPVEAIALNGVDPIFQAMMLDIAVGHFQGFERQVGQDHFGFEELVGAGDPDAARPRAQVQNPRRRLRQPGLEAPVDQLADGNAESARAHRR